MDKLLTEGRERERPALDDLLQNCCNTLGALNRAGI
jgi:hypothetical protein